MKQIKSFGELIADELYERFFRGLESEHLESVRVKYGLTILVVNGLKLVQVYFLALMLSTFKQTVITHLSFLLIRRYSYGYHASRSLVCTLQGCLLFVLIPRYLSCRNIIVSNNVIFFMGLIFVTVVLIFSPQVTEKGYIKNSKKLKIKATVAAVIVWLCCLVSNSMEFKIFSTYGLFLVCLMLIVRYLERKGGLTYEKT